MKLLNNFDNRLIDILKSCLKNCLECKIVVAYIRNSGLNPIINLLMDIRNSGGFIKIITTNQMGITEKEALISLLEIGADIRIYTNSKKTFHPKAYIFKSINSSKFIIGSSNLSRSALYDGVEWNIYFDDLNLVSLDVEKSFDRIWASIDTIILTQESINSFFKSTNEKPIDKFIEIEDAALIPQNILKESRESYNVSKSPDRTGHWRFNLAVIKVNRLLEKEGFNLIVSSDSHSPSEIAFEIPSEYLNDKIFPYIITNLSTGYPRYMFEIDKMTYQFNWQRSIKMDGKPFLKNVEK